MGANDRRRDTAAVFVRGGCAVALMASFAGYWDGSVQAEERPAAIGVLLAQAAISFDIPAQDLNSALLTFAERAGFQLIYDVSAVRDLQSAPLVGTFTPEEGLSQLLAGTGMTYTFSGTDTVSLRPASAEQSNADAVVLNPITVQGTSGSPAPAQDPRQGYKADYASTATRVSVPIQETPSSISVITSDLIEDTSSRTQGDALESVSGVARGNLRDGRGEDIVMRGFRYESGELVGAVKSNGLSGTNRFAPDPALIERYEVLKGPASIVGGAAQPGGVINRITKRPTAETRGSAQVEVGSFEFLRGVADIGGSIAESPAVRGRMIAAAETGGTHIDATESNQITVAPSLEVDTFDGAGRLFTTFHVQRFDGQTYAGGPLLEDNSTPSNAPEVNLGCLDADTCGTFTDAEERNAEVHYEHDVTDGVTLSLKGRYLDSEITSLNMSPFGNTDNTTTIWAGYSNTNGETYTGEASVKSSFSAFGQSHEVVAGIDHLNTESTNGNNWIYLGTQSITDPQTEYSVSRSDFGDLSFRESTLTQTGAFGQAVIRPIDRLTLVFGARQDWADISNENASVTNEASESDLTMRAGASVRVTDFMNVYAGYQESYVPNSTATDIDGVLLPSETGQNYEVGAKFDLLGGDLALTTALFRTYRQNVSTPDPDAPPGSSASVATGEQRHQGVELDLNGEPIPGLRLNANFTYLDMEITESNNASEVGNAPFRTPRDYVGRIFATYELQSGAMRGFGFGGGVYFHGGYHLDATNDVKSDAYQRVDLVGFYRGWENVDLQLNVRNLTDEVYVEAPGNPDSYTQFGAPLTVFASAKLRF